MARRILAIGLTLSLMMANAGISMGAVEPYTAVNATTTTFTKYLVMNADANVPNVTFKYTVVGGEAVAATDGKMEILAGIGRATIEDVTFSASDTKYTDTQQGDTITLDSGKAYAKRTATVTFSNATFNEPGIYRYIITEDNTTIQGITFDTTPTRTLDVYVIDNNGSLEVLNYVLHEGTDQPTTGTNNGTTGDVTKSAGYTNEYNTQNLTVKKEVSGNQASRDKYFKLTVTISNAIAGTKYNVDLTGADASSGATSATKGAYQNQTNATEIIVPEGATTVSTNFYLQGSQQVVIKGLAKGTRYTVSEDAEDYKSVAIGTIEGTIDSTDVETGFTNTRDGIVPTGVILDSAPFIIIIGLAVAALAFTALRKKSR